MGMLYIIATPIGNLKDITLRALEILKSVDVVLAEDTRVAKKLLSHYEIRKLILRYDEYASEAAHKELVSYLENGKNVAVVTDAGTPGISDPGARLVAYIRKELPEAKVIPVPGPSAVVSALSASGISSDQFTFLGYPPHKKGRQTFFKGLKDISMRPVVFYESTHRIEKALGSLLEVFGENQELVVARELTKIHEEIIRGTIKNAVAHFCGEHTKGEFVIIIP